MKYEQISENRFNCATCPTPCDGVSKEVYLFQNDSAFSEHFENELIAHINNSLDFKAQKAAVSERPDIEVMDKLSGAFSFYIEVKVQRRTFMSVEKILHESNLIPSETVALNLSDLLRYFELAEKSKLKIYVLWVVLNRPCIVGESDKRFFYSDTENLQKVYSKEKDKRRFRRKSGEGDIVDGEHKGVVVNYHFSLNELKEWKGF
ncbi:MAG: hypothetical protein POELPBGB_03574 [Bacteroidia bacterium]|nr:hypothetical protein [Bacteroidia bacterium]